MASELKIPDDLKDRHQHLRNWINGPADMGFPDEPSYDDELKLIERIARLEEEKTALQQEKEDLLKSFKASETWRKAYQIGKGKMYSMGGSVAEAAMSCLPCSEGPLDQRYWKYIETPYVEGIKAERDAERQRNDALQNKLDRAKKALGMIYDKYEDGITCYESSEGEIDESGTSIGNAVKLSFDEEAEILNIIVDAPEPYETACANCGKPYRAHLAQTKCSPDSDAKWFPKPLADAFASGQTPDSQPATEEGGAK